MQITADNIASTSSGARSKELQRRDAAHKASDKNKPFDPGGLYSPVALVAASFQEGGDRAIHSLRILGGESYLGSVFKFV